MKCKGCLKLQQRMTGELFCEEFESFSPEDLIELNDGKCNHIYTADNRLDWEFDEALDAFMKEFGKMYPDIMVDEFAHDLYSKIRDHLYPCNFDIVEKLIEDFEKE